MQHERFGGSYGTEDIVELILMKYVINSNSDRRRPFPGALNPVRVTSTDAVQGRTRPVVTVALTQFECASFCVRTHKRQQVMNGQGIRLVFTRLSAFGLLRKPSANRMEPQSHRFVGLPPIADLICVIESLHRIAIDQADLRRRSDQRLPPGSLAEPRLPEEFQGRPSVTDVPPRSAQA